MNITTERIVAAARKLCEAPGPSGRECAAYAAAKELLSPLGEVKRTPLGSLLCCINEGKEGAPHLLLEAHLDQIGFIVTRVEEGFLRFSKIGGIDARWLPATPVVIHAAEGDYPGIITSVPPHLAGDGSDRSIKIENLLIDTGFTAETAAKLFAPGDIVTFAAKPVELQNKRLAGPALDDRIGCAAVIAAAEEIAAEKPDCKVTVLLSSMEEVGGQGAETGGFTTQPDYAIAVDVSFGDGFGCAPEKTSPLGGGTMLGFSRPAAAEFSFLMAIPVMFGASLLKIIKADITYTASGILVLLVGMFVAFIVSVLAIRYLMRYIRTHDFKVFGYYRIVLGIIVLIFGALGFLA